MLLYDLLCLTLQTYAFTFLQIEAKGTVNGEKVEHQRTTFVKQLKLGKVSLSVHVVGHAWCVCGGGRLCQLLKNLSTALSSLPTAAPVPLYPSPAAQLVQPWHALEAARACAV